MLPPCLLPFRWSHWCSVLSLTKSQLCKSRIRTYFGIGHRIVRCIRLIIQKSLAYFENIKCVYFFVDYYYYLMLEIYIRLLVVLIRRKRGSKNISISAKSGNMLRLMFIIRQILVLFCIHY